MVDSLTYSRHSCTFTFCRELGDMVFNQLALTDLMSFAGTSNYFRFWIKDYIGRRRTALFHPFIAHIGAFVVLLRDTHSVVSGSCALSITQPRAEALRPHDMDIYTTKVFEKRVLRLLIKEEGYWIYYKTRATYTSSGMRQLFRLHRKNCTIDVIVTRHESSLVPIFHFHSTIVMNFISADSICSAYPRWTSKSMGLVNPRLYKYDLNLGAIDGLIKYTGRGFTLCAGSFEMGRHECYTSSYCPQTKRRTDDKGMLCWMMSGFNVSGLKPMVTWCLGGDRCEDERIPGCPPFVSVLY